MPGHRAAAAQRHHNALAVSPLQCACGFDNVSVGIALANLGACDRAKLGLVENEDVHEVEQAAVERRGRRRIEDGRGAGGSRPGDEGRDGRQGNLELTERDVACCQGGLRHVGYRQQSIGTRHNDD